MAKATHQKRFCSLAPLILLSGLFVFAALPIVLRLDSSGALAQNVPYNHPQEAERLRQQGLQYLRSNQPQAALEPFSQELELRRQLGDRPGEGESLNNLGASYARLGQYQEAFMPYEQALVIARENGDRQREGELLNNIGYLHSNLGQYPQALGYLQQALIIRQEIGDQVGEGVTLNNIGFIYESLGQYAQALDYYQQSRVIHEEIANRAGEGETINNIGFIYYSLGQYHQALDYFQQSLAIRQDIGDRYGEGISLNNIGGIYANLGRYPQALDYFQQSLGVRQQIGDRQGESVSLNNIGGIYASSGQYSQALGYYQQSLAILQQIGDRRSESESLNNIGGIHSGLGQYPQALSYYQQALVIRQEIGDRAGESESLNNVGGIYSSLGQYPQALNYYQQALVIRREIGDRAGEGESLNSIGLFHFYLDHYSQASDYFQQALEILQEIGDRRGEGVTLNNMGSVYYSLEQYPQALDYFQRALAIRQENGDRAGEAATLNNLGFTRLNIRELFQAEDIFFTSIAVLESLRRGGLTEEQQIALVETQRITFQGLQRVLITQNKIDTALEISERERARVFLEELERRLNPDAFAQLERLPPPNIAQIRQVAREQNATLVQYSIIQDEDLYIWVVQPTGAIAFRQISLQDQNLEIAKLVDATRTSMGVFRSIVTWGDIENASDHDEQSGSTTLNAQLQQLHQLLIDPIAEFLPADPDTPVVFIPQDELFLVPFAALQNADGTYLIDRHTILTTPAIQVLASTQVQQQQVQQANLQDSLVIGDPTMPLLSLVPGEPPLYLDNLPGAEQEARSIANLLDTDPLLGREATKAAVMEQMLRARIIHLATHGILDEFQGLNGGVVLAADGTGEFNDGVLTAAEIAQMDLNAEMVVLSACNTGQGRITGDGVVGLSRSLILAGVPTVVVSLWAVPDAPTGELMVEFYRQLELTDNKAQALRQAMLNIRDIYPDPIAWAAFTIIGEAE